MKKGKLTKTARLNTSGFSPRISAVFGIEKFGLKPKVLNSNFSINKKGDYELYFFMFTLIAAGMVILALIGFPEKIRKAELLDDLFLQRDIAMVKSAKLAAPGNGLIKYTQHSLANSSYIFSKDEIQILGDGKYVIIADKNFKMEEKTITIPKQIYFRNNGYNLEIDSELNDKPELIKYPLADTKGEGKKIYIEANGLESEKYGIVFGELESTKEPDFDIYISFELVKDAEQAAAEIPLTNALKSRKLASLILNKLQQPGIIYFSDNANAAKAKEAGVIIKSPQLIEVHEALKDYNG